MKEVGFDSSLDLKIERVVDVPVEKIWNSWTQPEQLKNWFCPKPWETTDCRIDLRPGGEFYTMMKGPNGEAFGNAGCYLEIVQNQRLVWTSALAPGFRPVDSHLPFTAFLLLEKEGNGTRYIAIAKHKTEESRKQHQEMGFEQGWSIVLDQLVSYLKNT